MKARWRALAARIDALNLRERALLFLSVLGVCAAVVNQLWVAPAQTAYEQVRRGIAGQGAELQRLREELRSKASEPDPARLARDELVRLKVEIAAADRDIAALAVFNKGTMTLPEVLVHFLRRHGGLTLVRTTNLTGDVAASGSVSASQASLATGAAPTGASALVRQGLELTVSGPYLELVRYVQTLEDALPSLRWGSLKLRAEQQPPELSLQVFLIGPQP